MVNFKLGSETKEKKVEEAWDKEKSEFSTGIEPMTCQTLGGRSFH